MSHFTSFEAKQLAAYLNASCLLVPEFSGSPKLGQWLNAISHSCGFRDWNAMTAVVPEVPEVQMGEWYEVFFGIARVLTKGQDATNHLVWYRNRDSSRHEAATTLARSVLARTGRRIQGIRFNHSQPDTPSPEIEEATLGLARQWSKFPWSARAPIVAISTDRATTILLWWLSERYTMAEHYPERERRFSYQSLSFDDAPHRCWVNEPQNTESLTDHFLSEITGVVRPKRTCLYVPEIPNGLDESFIPIVVQEGSRTGEPTAFNFGSNRYEALGHAQILNLKDGVTLADMNTISRRFQEYEEKEEELMFDDFGGSDGSD